jgi:transposase-like protein
MWDRISELWCRRMHSRAMWPIHGRYLCRQCLREYTVKWEGPARAAEYADPAARERQYPMTDPIITA